MSKAKAKAREPAATAKASSLAPQTLASAAQSNGGFADVRSGGNLAVQQLLRVGAIQAKLTVGSPADSYEREADRMAEHVLSSAQPGRVQRKCSACAGAASCAECDDTGRIRAQARPGSTPHSSSGAGATIDALRGGGQPLSSTIRSFFEPRFGRDFSGVRVHTDDHAADSARSIQARAYTAQQNVVFGAGEYAPESADGQRLLAHELAHVMQQTSHAGSPGSQSIQREVDPLLTMSITPDYARAYSDEDLGKEIEKLQWYVIQHRFEVSAEELGAQGNLQVLRNEQARRTVVAEGVDTAPAPGGTVEQRHQAFIRRVLGEARARLRYNQLNLQQWRSLVENAFSDPDLYKQTYAQLSSDLFRTANEQGTVRAYHEWAGTRGAHMREHQQEVIAGRRHACMGCHGALIAAEQDRDDRRMGIPQLAPMEKLPMLADPRYGNEPVAPRMLTSEQLVAAQMSGQSTAVVLDAINRIRPMLEPLGPYGADVLPQELLNLFGNASPAELRAAILTKIDSRMSDYGLLRARIANGAIEYLDLSVVLEELRPTADADVQRAVQQDIDNRRTNPLVMLGEILIKTLLAILFPPYGLVLAAQMIYAGYQQYQLGRNYQLGHGAHNVFTRGQQESAGELMAGGTMTMGMGLVALGTMSPAVMDWSATEVAIMSDMRAAQRLATRAASGPIPEAEVMQLAQRGFVGRTAHGFLDWRGYQMLYRGQGAASAEILSPLAQQEGLAASRAMVDSLRVQGLTDAEIASYTARFNAEPVPGMFTPPGMQPNQPLGAAGIPTTRLPNIAADFATGESGVIYILRVPKNMPVEVGAYGWGQQSVVEFENVVFHQIPGGYVVRTVSPGGIPALRAEFVDSAGWSLTPPPPRTP